jgi:hypothetical protein
MFLLPETVHDVPCDYQCGGCKQEIIGVKEDQVAMTPELTVLNRNKDVESEYPCEV